MDAQGRSRKSLVVWAVNRVNVHFVWSKWRLLSFRGSKAISGQSCTHTVTEIAASLRSSHDRIKWADEMGAAAGLCRPAGDAAAKCGRVCPHQPTRGRHVAHQRPRSRNPRRRGAAGPEERPAPHRPAQIAGDQADGGHQRARLDHLRRRRHRLSRRHGRAMVRQHRLRPRRTGRGRGRPDAAARVFSAHADERARRGAGGEDQHADGRRLSHLLRQLGLRGERGRLQVRPAIPEARASRRFPLQDRQPLLRLPRHDAGDARRWRHGRSQGKVRAVLGRLRARRTAVLLPLPVRPDLSELRPGLREEHGKRDPGRESGHHRRGDRGADHERDRRRRAARRIPAGGGGDLPSLRHPAARRRGDQRLRPHREDVRPPALRRVAGHHRGGQGDLVAPTCRSPRPW